MHLTKVCQCIQKHLHVRGEDHDELQAHVAQRETPPRTWRRLVTVLGLIDNTGNTSTYVEKTISSM